MECTECTRLKQEHRLAVLAEVEAQRALDDASRESTPSEWEHRKAEADTARKTSAEAEESIQQSRADSLAFNLTTANVAILSPLLA